MILEWSCQLPYTCKKTKCLKKPNTFSRSGLDKQRKLKQPSNGKAPSPTEHEAFMVFPLLPQNKYLDKNSKTISTINERKSGKKQQKDVHI